MAELRGDDIEEAVDDVHVKLRLDEGRTFGQVQAFYRPLLVALCTGDGARVAHAFADLPEDPIVGNLLVIGEHFPF